MVFKCGGLEENSCFTITGDNFFFFLTTPCGMQNFSDQESSLRPLQWKLRVLTTGPPGKSRRHMSLFLLPPLTCLSAHIVRGLNRIGGWSGQCSLQKLPW